ncbi:MAG: universal stress protein [Desulfobacterales bacterium]|nr:universal stress protein [Desulfobacterales bacterium]MDD4072560.1 universal stress protein [Desulfobacterales bacterium]MDD4393829.1 universal stress protein [Desulfobacterales bacterium]
MKRFKNILLIYDETIEGRSALERAVHLAMDNEARLKLVHVIKEIPADELVMISSANSGKLEKMLVERKSLEMKQFLRPFVLRGLTAEVKVIVGVPFISITQEVIRCEHDLVVKVAEGRRVLDAIMFGTTAIRLMRKCPGPVWIMKPSDHQGYRNIMAAVDPGPVVDERYRLNHLIMGLASSLALLEHCRLHVVHVWKPPGTTLHGESSGKIPGKSFNHFAREAMQFHRKWTVALVEPYTSPILGSRIYLKEGEPEKIIPQMAQELSMDLIVMGTVCRTGIAGFFIGNTAEKVLRQVNCSVLTVKPEGFISPVCLEQAIKVPVF